MSSGQGRYVLFMPTIVRARDLERFGLPLFEARGFKVEVVQLTRLMGPRSAADAVDAQCLLPSSRDELDAFMATLGPHDVAFVPIGLARDTAWFFHLLAKHSVRYIVAHLGSVPISRFLTWRAARSLREALAFKLTDYLGMVHRLKGFLSLALAPSVGYWRLTAPELWVRAGKASRHYSLFPKPWAAIPLEVASFDLVQACAEQANPSPTPPGPYAVYLDQDMISHPDYALTGTKNPVSAEAFFPALRRSFDWIETNTGMPVIIAVHPKSNYQTDAEFGGRKMILGQSCALVHGASLVLAHWSTAISFAVIFRKPLLFLTSGELEHSDLVGYVARFSSWVGSRRINIEKVEQELPLPIRLPKVDERLYRNYEKHFLSQGGKLGSVWQIVIDMLESRRI